MNEKKFVVISPKSLTINDTLALAKSTIDIVEPDQGLMCDTSRLALASLKISTTKISSVSNIPRESSITKIINEKNKLVKKYFGEIKKISSAFIDSSIDDKQKASAELSKLLSPYKEIEKIKKVSKSATISEMLQKYNNSNTYKNAAQILGLEQVFTKLEEANKEYDTLYKTRNSEQSNKVTETSTDIKPIVLDHYSNLCVLIELTVNYAPTPERIALFNKINELRKKFHTTKTKSKTEDINANVKVA